MNGFLNSTFRERDAFNTSENIKKLDVRKLQKKDKEWKIQLLIQLFSVLPFIVFTIHTILFLFFWPNFKLHPLSLVKV
jgi:hypothetical protein